MLRRFSLGAALAVLAVTAGAAAPDLLGGTVVDSLVSPKGAFVNVVTPGGAIASAGLLSGDVITSADGKPVTGAASLNVILARHHAGDRIPMNVTHLGKPGQFTLVLAATGEAPQTAAAQSYSVSASGAVKSAPQAPAQTQTRSANAAAPAANVQWTSYADRAEHAFTIQVPAGWRVQGGTVRKNAIEIPMGVDATSPDGSITIFYGDPNVPIYSVPAAIMGMGGLRPGMTYNMGQGVSTVIEPYMDGATFSARWGIGRVGRNCTQVKLMASRARPDSTQGLDRAYAQGGISTTVQAGEASFSCDMGGRQAGGYVFAATELVRSQTGQLWDVKYLTGAIATADKAAEAYAILAHMAASFTIDRNWMARQQQISGQFDQVVAQTNAIVAQRIQDNGRAAMQASQNMIDNMRKNSDANFNAVEAGEKNANTVFNANENYDAFAVRGTSDFVNPDTGTGYSNLDNSYSHTFVNNDGDIRQTNSENSPGSGWHELQMVPAGQ